MMRIDLYANDGSPLGVTPDFIYGRGVGGAELAMMSWAETMAERGHQVRIYNNPLESGYYNDVLYLPQGTFNPVEKRDVFICYRSPNPYLRIVKADVKIHWSCDQYTIGHFGRDIVPFVDHVVCISPYHRDYYLRRYGGGEKVGYLDLGVRLQDYDIEVERVPGRCIYCSVPDRGLVLLRHLWPRIKASVPDASLVITADYRLWGAPESLNHQHKMSWHGLKDVEFLGKIERDELAKQQLMASCHSYPCGYEELFCISAAECQVAGAIPVTSDIGALATTNIMQPIDGDMSTPEWQDNFVERVIDVLNGGMSKSDRPVMQRMAHERFDWQRICGQWEALIETGEFEKEQVLA